MAMGAIWNYRPSLTFVAVSFRIPYDSRNITSSIFYIVFIHTNEANGSKIICFISIRNDAPNCAAGICHVPIPPQVFASKGVSFKKIVASDVTQTGAPFVPVISKFEPAFSLYLLTVSLTLGTHVLSSWSPLGTSSKVVPEATIALKNAVLILME